MRRRRVAAAVVAGLIATLAAAVPFAPAGRAEPAPDPEPTGSGQPSTPPPPPVQIALTAQDIAVGSGYWQGAAETYRLTVRVRNTGKPDVKALTQVTLPTGVSRSGAAAGGCVVDLLSFDCAIAAQAEVTITVDVTVAPGLWRDPPTGSVRTVATAESPGRSVTAEATFGLDFPPGPPTPGIDLSVSDPFLPAEPAAGARSETTTLEVRLANTGAVQADGVVDVVTPDGWRSPPCRHSASPGCGSPPTGSGARWDAFPPGSGSPCGSPSWCRARCGPRRRCWATCTPPSPGGAGCRRRPGVLLGPHHRPAGRPGTIRRKVIPR